MKPRISIITLAVEDLERSLAFYRDGLGFPGTGIEKGFNDHVLFNMQEGLSLVLYLRSAMTKITGNAAAHSSSVILSYAAKDIEDVNHILEQAQHAGAVLCGKPEQHSWGYFGYFKDPDGHIWEVLCG